MYRFPPILDGNAGVKMTNNADTGFLRPGIREIFYSNRDGNWTDPGIWETASGRVGLTPGPNDDVYVRNVVTVTGGNSTTLNCNNLIITNNGTLNGGCILNIFGNLLSYGTLNFIPNATNIANGRLVLYGVNNYIDKTKQTPTLFLYAGLTSQPIIDANYSAICFGGLGEKYLTCDLTIGSMFGNVSGGNYWFNLKNFNFTCNGLYDTVNSALATYVEGNQTLIFKGSTSFWGGLYCLNSPTIEFQNNTFLGAGNNSTLLRWNFPYGTGNSYLGTGVVRFTTNNQTLNGIFVSLTLDNTIEIADNITLTIDYPTTAGAGTSLSLTNTINGLGVNSRLRQSSNSVLNFSTATAATTAMTTGIIDFTTNVNTVQFSGNYSATISPTLSTFHNLTIGGTGTKTLGVNTTLNGNFVNSVGASFEMSTFNLTVNGTTTVGSTGTFSKNGAGNILFVGAFNVSTTNGTPTVSFLGNPNIEFRNGFTILILTGGGGVFNSGTGTWSFTTNNQNVSTGQFNSVITFNCTMSVVGITITHTSSGVFIMNGVMNGTTAGSTFINNGTFYLQSTTYPMATGVFTNSTTQGTIGFIMNSNFTIPSSLSTVFSLYISGTGTKTLSTNTVVNGNFQINSTYGNGTFECSTFDLTINGTSTIGSGGTFSKNGAGNILFVGLLNFNTATMSLPGNPNVELRNGASLSNFGGSNTGTGTWNFTTNAQSITMSSGVPVTFNCGILIANDIVLTYGSSVTMVIVGVLNGSNAGSTFRMGTSSPTLNYQNATQPMATGILDTSTNSNTWIYGAGNQDVKGGTPQQYRNLRFSGTGTTKTLQGNINVQNTYTVDSGVTVNLNGFTKTP